MELNYRRLFNISRVNDILNGDFEFFNFFHGVQLFQIAVIVEYLDDFVYTSTDVPLFLRSKFGEEINFPAISCIVIRLNFHTKVVHTF